MNDSGSKSAVPMTFWLIAVLSLLWNAFGGYLYTMANMGDASVIDSAPPEMQAYMAAMPIWAHSGWAIGIWGSVLGSLLLLGRSRHAVTAFLASFVGAVVSYAAQAQAGVLSAAAPAMILSVIALQWWYCRRCTNKGWLA